MTEFNPFFKKFSGKLKKVAIVYPNRYIGGISNLGIQRLYFEVNREKDYIAERFYTDIFEGLRSIESGTPLRDFDVALFSIQYEEDFFNAVRILERSGFRGFSVAGGPGVTQNPFPYIKHFERLFIGEAENAVIGVIEDSEVEGLFPKSKKRRIAELDSEMKSQIIGEGAYGRAILIEIGRGCPRGCRFCIVRQIYSPPRWRKKEEILEIAEENRDKADKIALIAPSPTDHPEFLDIVFDLKNMGFEVSPSSIRADRFDEEYAEVLGNVRTITIAPEAGSKRLREAINKGIDEEDVIRVAEVSKAEKIKLYFMFGLPGEGFEDLDAVAKMVEEIRKRGKRVAVSINPLVPKPHTPFQWLPFGGNPELDVKDNLAELRKKREYLIKILRGKAQIDIEGIESFAIQTIISRGDRSVGELVDKKLTLNRIFKYGLSKFLDKIPLGEKLLWDEINMRYRKERLEKEFERSIEILGLHFS